ncbi:MAG: cysteine-rich CWC family protein [Rubrivivax sp.]
MNPPARPLPEPLCPLCGGPNECRPAATGSFGEACWCRSVAFPAELLAAVPEPKRAIACICRNCAERAAQSL